ncbi:MAG: T9SS type A sorting domain-containing protein [candidate division Zixibacteria bacterium]|nr:T9SS type A sorting domain-containing protein [candidate division Zixibacteria bacterium]
MRNPPLDWCFTVTDVVYSGAVYDSGANQVTEACESGWVFGINGLSSTRPDDFGLHQNRPNPFNPVTEISFRLESPTSVRLAIYNITGQRVASLINGIMDAGLHSVTWDGSAYSSGIYFYRLETEYGIESRKMILMK